ncbi:MAG: DUF192 domain-containing protein [Bacilli bacterium]|nr:DUF192 domain-containing protein [Bacilli bacterium]
MYLIIDSNKILIKKANGFVKRLLGFMGKKDINYGILFKKTNSVHTFFMKENIDIIGLNKNNEIIYKAVNIPKNQIIKINSKIKNTSILELPSNTSKKLKIGEKLTFISE